MSAAAERSRIAADLRIRAERLLADTGLLDLLAAKLGDALVTGSMSYDLMAWPDIDIHMPVDPASRVAYAALLGEVAAALAAGGVRLHRAQFLDDHVEPHPLGAGLYLGLELRDAGGMAWKCDLWGWEPADFARRRERDRGLRDALAAADRDLILRLKAEARARPGFYGVVAGSMDIYRFAMAGAGTTLAELVDWVRRPAAPPPAAAAKPAPGRVRRLTAADVDAWVAMRRRLFPVDSAAVAREEALAILAREDEAAFAVRAGEAWLGFIELRERSHGEGCAASPVGYIEALWTEADARRQGVARSLVTAAVAWCGERGLGDLCSDTEIDNVVSQAVHRRLGFEETERLVTFRLGVQAAAAAAARSPGGVA